MKKIKILTLALAGSLLAGPALALEPIDEGEVTFGQGSLNIQPPGCERGPLFDSTTEVSAGTLTRDSIQKTFEANVGALSAVYLRALVRNRCLAGSVRIHVDTAATGFVTHVELEFSNPGIAILRAELAQAVAGFRFELTGKPARFSYTLNLEPGR